MSLKSGVEQWVATGALMRLGRREAGSSVRVEFTTTLPRGNGVLTFRGHAAYLLGGWHPVVVVDGADKDSEIDYAISVPAASGCSGRRNGEGPNS